MNKHHRGTMLCIIAFGIGLICAFAGCSAVSKTETQLFNNQAEFGGGFYLQKGGESWK
tara:strand:- start:3261 stop:3434 length:174 start_codon:yes stop_codon:yes gene_type:complete